MTNEERDKREAEIAAIVALLLRRAQRLLRAAFRSVVVPVAGQAVFEQDVTSAVIDTSRRSVLVIRNGARVSAAEAWEKSTGSPGIDQDLEARAHDEARAMRAAQSLGRQWTELAIDAVALNELATAMGPRLDRTAETEAMEAFADETARQVDEAVGAGVVLIERWCARLDACPHCAEMNGTIAVRPQVLDIPAHPRCRCFPLVELVPAFQAVA